MRPGDFAWCALADAAGAGAAFTVPALRGERGWTSPRPMFLVLASDGLEVWAPCSTAGHERAILLTPQHLRRGPQGWPRRECWVSPGRLLLAPAGVVSGMNTARVVCPPSEVVAAAGLLLCLARAMDPYLAAEAFALHDERARMAL